jgi:hypothetical protein
MSTEDTTIWRKFQRTDRTKWQRFYFDVGVGDGKPTGDDVDDDSKAYWLKETQKRIDVLGIADTFQAIIELRNNAQPNALGRLLVYKQLYSRDPLSTLPLQLWLVTNTPDPELRAIAEPMGVRYFVVE